VKFVPAQRLRVNARTGGPRRIRRGLKFNVAAAHRPLVHHDVRRQCASHLIDLSLPLQGAGQVHQAATLGIDRQARIDGCTDALTQRRVGLQLRHENFGETTADEQTVQFGQARVVQGVERDDLGTR
jgi:hypothetical protein